MSPGRRRDLGFDGEPDHGHVTGDEDQGHGQHGVRVSALAPEEPQVLDQHPIGQAQHHQGEQPDEDEAGGGRSPARTPMPARATTEKRLTAQPWAASKEPKEPSHDERNWGCGVWAIVWTIPSACRRAPPLPEPPAGPGLQDSHAHQEDTADREDDAAQAGGGERPFGQRDQNARNAVEENGPRRPEQPGRPGAKMPPNASPKTHTRSPQPALPSPASRDHRPRGATSNQSPSPTWIQTVADAAWIG